MKKMILALAAVMMWAGANAQQQYQERDYVEINARAYREVAPDEIYLKIVLDQNDTKGKYTIDQLESQLYQALKKAGVDAEKELRVSDMDNELKSFLLKRNEGRISKEYILKVDNQHLMPVFRELDKVGIANVNVQKSRYSKTEEVYNELLGEAVAKAKTRAGIMAKAGGGTTGKMIFIQSYDNTANYDAGMATNMVMYKSRSMEMEAAPTFEFNKIRIEATVTVRFAL